MKRHFVPAFGPKMAACRMRGVAHLVSNPTGVDCLRCLNVMRAQAKRILKAEKKWGRE
jgi:hypothetical protein